MARRKSESDEGRGLAFLDGNRVEVKEVLKGDVKTNLIAVYDSDTDSYAIARMDSPDNDFIETGFQSVEATESYHVGHNGRPFKTTHDGDVHASDTKFGSCHFLWWRELQGIAVDDAGSRASNGK